MKNTSIHYALFFICICSYSLKAQEMTASLITFSSGYNLPLDIQNCKDSRLFIVQKDGKIMIADSTGKKLKTPFLNISNRITTAGEEQGLLGLAFDPNYSTNGYFYVNYVDLNEHTQISRFKVSAANANKANVTSEKFLLNVAQPYANHNGGCMRFGPDGYLYISMGDGGSGGNPENTAQDLSSLLGKILRIDVHSGTTYGIPPTNPYANSSTARKEIWASGMRNPWRFSFDAQTGDLWIGDVGQDAWEEIDLQNANDAGGKNYGWRCYEGNHAYNTSGCQPQSNYSSPIVEYPHSNGDCSITGGFVYRGSRYPQLLGKYVYCDYCSGTFRSVNKKNGNWVSKDLFKGNTYSYSSFGEDRNKELFVANFSNGNIYRVASGSTIAASDESAEAITAHTDILNVYPNPAAGNLNIKYRSEKTGSCNIIIYNAGGDKIYTARKILSAGLNIWNIALPKVAKGNYYLKLYDDNGLQLSKNLTLE
ncbi:MAG: PQQ-dependent sugar dehydrogenase [Panacibacter sp.]